MTTQPSEQAVAPEPQDKPVVTGGDSAALLYGDNKTPEEQAAAAKEQEKPVEEAKPDAEKKDGEADKKDDKSKEQTADADKVPEDGKYNLTMPEGVELDQAMADAIMPVMKDIGLTNAQADKLAQAYAERRKSEFESMTGRHDKIVTDWQNDIRTDREYGGDKLDASLKIANRALATYAKPEEIKRLTEIGMGNHPDLFRLLVRVGNANSDDKPVTSETPAASRPKDIAETLYGPTEG